MVLKIAHSGKRLREALSSFTVRDILTEFWDLHFLWDLAQRQMHARCWPLKRDFLRHLLCKCVQFPFWLNIFILCDWYYESTIPSDHFLLFLFLIFILFFLDRTERN